MGNGFVLWFYGKNKKLTGQVYILALAVIDLVCCVVMLPQMPLFELAAMRRSENENIAMFRYTASLLATYQIVCYFGIQVAMALDQLIAVSWPFRHARLRRNVNYAALVIGGILFVILTAFRTALFMQNAPAENYSLVFITVSCVPVVILVIVYPATAYKLYLKSATVHTQPQNSLRDVPKATQNNPQPMATPHNHKPITNTPHSKTSCITKLPDTNTKSMHVRALKIYAAILLQFVMATLASSVMTVIFVERWALYFFYINHIGNPVIYYCFVPKFREGVKEIARALCHRM